MAQVALARGAKLGRWSLTRKLGAGGNGQVWEAVDAVGEVVAVKVLTKVKEIAYARFQAEVKILDENVDVPGILPIRDKFLPEKLGDETAWYAMPVAVPLQEHLRNADALAIAAAIEDIAATLAALHLRRISHRDVKPNNMLVTGGRAYLADFGLVDYPGKDDLTGERQDLGPRWTMAPEIRRWQDNADYRAADVYSLAKSLWIMLTRNNSGFDGQYSRDGSIAIAHFGANRETFLHDLDVLLAEATEHDATRRPTMAEFAARLRAWREVAGDYQRHNPREWGATLQRLFPVATPDRVEWRSLEDVFCVLSLLGGVDALNHLFFPEGGGLDLELARPADAREPGCIEIVTNGLVSILKPTRLLFESFGPGMAEWSYFRLEAAELLPTGLYPDLSGGHEEVTDVGQQEYADRACWDHGEFKGNPLPANSRALARYFGGGSFVVFQKTSPYNRDPATYDGRHDKMNADQFRAYIERESKVARPAGIRRIKLASGTE